MSTHHDIVRKLLDAKTVDFAAIGKQVAELGPSLALADEPGDFFCGTNRFFIHFYRIFNPGIPVENLGELGQATAGIR